MDTPVEGQTPVAIEQAVRRKPYHAPVLQVYGDIRTLTQSNNAGNSDGMGGAGMQGTHA